MTALTESVVTLGGREFTVINFERRTATIELYLQRLWHRGGLDQLAPAEGEPAADYLVRLHDALLLSGYGPDVIAGRLLPVGASPESWNAETAAEIAAHIGRCNTPEDRDRFLVLGVRMVGEMFFLAGLDRLNHDLERSKGRG